MSRLSKCKKCGSQLVDGPDAERNGSNGRFALAIRRVPTMVCSRGCPGAYWYDLDFGVEVIETFSSDSPNIAKRKRLLLKTRDLCKRCNVELKDRHQLAQFTSNPRISKGTEIELILEAPCLECAQCGSKYLPAQRSTWDPYYSELADVISAVITKDLIRD